MVSKNNSPTDRNRLGEGGELVSKKEIVEEKIRELEALRKTLDRSDPKKLETVRKLHKLEIDLSYLKSQEQQQKKEQQKIAKKEKTKKEKRDSKLKKALEAGARVVERSISKVGWDIAHDKVKVVNGKLDYRSWQILDCVADKIAQGEWIADVFNLSRSNSGVDVSGERQMVFISATEFKKYIGDQNISNKNLVKIFEDLPKATLKGEVAIPFYFPKYQWVTVDFYVDNICGVAIAREHKEFEKYRSKKKLRGKGSGKEEPVFILIFSNPFGQTFVEHAKKREACQLLNQKVYELGHNVQELFQVVRWNEKGPVIVNPEFISRACGWKWPPSNIYLRVKRCKKLLDILHEENLINKPVPRGETVEKRDWLFYISKGRGAKRKMELIKNPLGDN